MTTTLTVTLSSDLKDELEKPGVAAELVYYDSENDTATTDVVNNGSIITNGTYTITLPYPMVSGVVYFVVQSLNGTNDASNPQSIFNQITSQADISYTNGGSLDFGYAEFEVNLQNGPDDVADISSVNQFSIPVGVTVDYSPGSTATLGYGVSGDDLIDQFQSIQVQGTTINSDIVSYFTQGPLETSDTVRSVIAPTDSVGIAQGGSFTPPFTDSDWDNYVNSIITYLENSGTIVLSGDFVGSKDASGMYHNAGYYAYQLDYTGGDFWLEPLANSQIKGYIKIAPDQLDQSIYSTIGTVDIYSNMTDPTPYLAGMNTGDNNEWGSVLVSLFTGFSAGYFDTSGAPLNQQLTTTVDLDQNINWDPTYAFHADPAADSTVPDGYYYDPYSQIFFDSSNSYGSNYSDALMKEYDVGGPQVSVYDGNTNADVSNITLSLYANSDVPDPNKAHGYTPPQIYNYIAPNGGTYDVPNTVTSTISVVFNFAAIFASTAGVVLNPESTFDLKVLTSDASGTPTWTDITLPGNADSLWHNWQIVQSGGSYTATAVADDAYGSLTLTDFPIADSGVSWYQVVVGGKTFNLYTTTLNGAFENPTYENKGTVAQAGALAIDGQASIATPGSTTADQTIDTFTVNLLTGSGTSVGPADLIVNSDSTTVTGLGDQPWAPIAGILSSGTLSAFAGQDYQIVQDMTTMMVTSNTITIDASDIAFGWTGDNNAPDANTSSWVSGYTNRLTADDVALITIQQMAGSMDVGMPITTTATADIDGIWLSGTVDLANGFYRITETEYAPTDTSFSTPLSRESGALDLTVTCFVAGTRIRTVAGHVPVERLAVGDMVRTHRGDAQPIVWIGHRSLRCNRHPRPAEVWPVRVSANAFGPNAPHRDLWLSPDHAIYHDGSLIPVKYLVNGTSVAQFPRDEVTYYHVELQSHDVVLAEGLPTETYLDTGDREKFANGGAVVRLHADCTGARPSGDATLIWEAKGYAPLVTTGDRLATARKLVDDRALHLVPRRHIPPRQVASAVGA